MVLEKRKRDGGFEPWRPAGSSPSHAPTLSASSQQQAGPSEIDALPPAKKPRQEPIITSKPAPSPYSNPIPVASSSQTPILSQSTPAKKTRPKAGDLPAATPEKRGAVFKKKCPQNILDRVERVRTQRFFMVDRKRFEGELKEEFKVLGSTGNIYTVTIQQRPSCDCPDAQKGNHCKHILFIYLKVLQVTQSSGHWYQKYFVTFPVTQNIADSSFLRALLTSELESIFENAPLAPNALAHPRIREAYARATGKTQTPSTPEPEVAAGPKKRIPGEDDDCPICYDNMYGATEASLTFCEECGNAVHGVCFAQWKQTSANQGKKLTCIYCRAEWPNAAAAGGRASGSGSGARTTSAGYINISGVAGVSPQRDTSTYYHGPRRGQRYYGYNEYDDDY
ncbi:hypothetical protein MVEN_02230600 [Mycena venus]|uniref:SWIM-type domain-containing protein n=1 Tax=Mycena venus TaxID=2733690 RepID=A0A8H6X851_9AGAR|nr:hypothetical protein MVEN_02230600 [Mycena venus]